MQDTRPLNENPMKKLSYSILLIFISLPSFSQTIINAEGLIDGKDSTILALSFSYSGTRGNSTTDQLSISPTMIFIANKNEYKILGGYGVLTQSGSKILNNGFVHLRHNYRFTSRLQSFEFYQVQFNDVLLLDKREVFGGGLRYALLNKDSLSYSINMGLMREHEVLNTLRLEPGEVYETRYFRGTFISSLKVIINKSLRLDNVTYYQPYLQDFSDYRLLNELTITSSINDHLKILATLSTRYDSKPPSALRGLDNIVSLGINVKI